MDPLRVAVVGPGRAGGAVALRARDAGHQLVALVPGPSGSVPEALSDVPSSEEGALPEHDLLVVAVPDDAIPEVAAALVPRLGEHGAAHVAIHLSGLTPLAALDALADAGVAIGGLHPLMTLPTAAAGAASLAGAPAGVSARSETVATLLTGFAESLGMRPFDLPDDARALYHAAASVGANVVTAVLGLSFDLFDGSGVDPSVSRPLIEQAVQSCFELGPDAALTGPVSRGDVGTVARQREAVRALDPALAAEFDTLLDVLRSRAVGRGDA